MTISSRVLVISFVVVTVIAVTNRYLMHDALAARVGEWVRMPASRLMEKFSFVKSFISELKHVRTLAQENANLRREHDALLARLAEQESLRSENSFLRQSLRVQQRVAQPLLTAGVYSSGLHGPSYQVMINRGQTDGVMVGHIVATSEGVLIGRIKEVLPHVAVVQLVSDPSLEIAVQVLGKDTMGIARGDLDRGISLNLVVQEEDISEADTLVSNGHDGFPAGLIVGTVSHIEINESEIFKRIRVEPRAANIPIGPVLLLPFSQ